MTSSGLVLDRFSHLLFATQALQDEQVLAFGTVVSILTPLRERSCEVNRPWGGVECVCVGGGGAEGGRGLL